ncbi:MAG: hypothetical protein ACI4U9_00075, partial [Clostridia bacterium]
ELYSNSEYGKARGMTIEDVNRALNYTPLGGYYIDGENKARTTGNLTTKLKDVPIFSSLKANGTKTPDGVNTEEALGNYELNGYAYYLNDEGTILVNPVNDTTSAVTTIEKNIIFGASTDYAYWLASRGVYADADCAGFGPGFVYCGSASSCFAFFYFFDSNGGEDGINAGLRPVVSLRSKLPKGLVKITFTIEDETFEALEGMTWEEWGNSSFCTGNFDIKYGYPRINYNCIDAAPDDVIRPGGIYSYVDIIT